MASLVDRAKHLLGARRTAYVRTFNTGHNAYADAVLRDLAKFCRAYEPTFHDDPRLHALLEGRREVWLRIQDYARLSPDELFEKYGKKMPDSTVSR